MQQVVHVKSTKCYGKMIMNKINITLIIKVFFQRVKGIGMQESL
jgi:hypothetical protein